MKKSAIGLLAITAATLSACVTPPSVSPVEVTRFHQSAASAQLGSGTIFIENAPGMDADSLELTPYKEALAQELTRLGYQETARADAQYVAQLRVARFVNKPGQKRGPVSVGVGGSTGSYGSGLGLGVGFNLGGGPRTMLGTDLGVMIREASSNDVLWEGRASFTVSDNSSLADNSANASAITDALFREFPGNNGETVEMRVAN